MIPQQTLDPDRKDELLRLLADEGRRRTLAALQDAPADVVSLQELADEVDDGAHAGDATAVQLVHSTLPKLAAAGVLEFDQRSRTVRYHGAPEVEGMLDLVAEV